MNSAETRLILLSDDIGSILFVVFISYFEGKGHRPRWIGISAVFVAIGKILPFQFVEEKYLMYICEIMWTYIPVQLLLFFIKELDCSQHLSTSRLPTIFQN